MSDDEPYDVVIVGAGPAGSSCAAFCAGAGLRTLVLERARFPRDKVCGDCLNPSCFPVLERLGVREELDGLVHSNLASVDFIPLQGAPISLSIRGAGEISVKRSLLDDLLLRNAVAKGAAVIQETTVTGMETGWTLRTEGGSYRARFLVGADGRNSQVARAAGLRGNARKVDRVAIQTHVALPSRLRERVVLHLFPEGYAGYADVGGDELNLCLVGPSKHLDRLKEEAAKLFSIQDRTRWNSVTPITRPDACVAGPGVFLVGDAARVVEPFTGEGIYYALRSGELAADSIVRACRGETSEAQASASYRVAHPGIYRSRLWVNRLARTAVVSPWLGDRLLRLGRSQTWLLKYLTSKIVGTSACRSD